MKVVLKVLSERIVNIPDNYLKKVGSGYELTKAGYEKYMGETSCALDENDESVYRIETMNGDLIAD